MRRTSAMASDHELLLWSDAIAWNVKRWSCMGELSFPRRRESSVVHCKVTGSPPSRGRRLTSKCLRHASLDPSRRERLEARAAVTADPPGRSLSIERERQIDAPALGEEPFDAERRRECAERREPRVRRVGLSGNESLRKRRVAIEVGSALRVITQARRQRESGRQRLSPRGLEHMRGY